MAHQDRPFNAADAIPTVGFRPDQLAGFRIGVTSDRRSEELIAALERRGAEVFHAPTIRMAGATDDSTVVDQTRAIIDAAPDILLATTSYGIRRWIEAADAAGLGDEVLDAIGSSRILVRGPKARGAIRTLGLEDHGMSERETTPSLVDLVLRHDVRGKVIAVQLHGYTNPWQLDRLTKAGATVLTVAPYRWVANEDEPRVSRLVDLIATESLDAVTFTSAPAVEALFDFAAARGREQDVQAAFRGNVVAAAVGPVTAAPLIEADILPIFPDRFRMGALIRLVCEHLESIGMRSLDTVAGPVELRGKIVRSGDEQMALSPVALALFRALFAAQGATISRIALAQSVPDPLDDHAVDVAISRLRQSLPDPRIVQTVIKRGYRIALADD
ncbi:uroporphyrinogen-III synthase [Microbacter sp. GSS18]|nr:uroporphyrinogen-III synthase [Microbacter sp. GSS18]